MSDRPAIDPDLDLLLERVVPVPPEKVWAAWTTPELLLQWFCPAPWSTVAATIDLRPGGEFTTTMRSPEGVDQPPSVGCFLEVVEHRRLTFTDALGPGYRPAQAGFMTATILFEPEGDGCRYTAIARHVDVAGRQQHEEMGFRNGWGAALDQLVALMSAG